MDSSEDHQLARLRAHGIQRFGMWGKQHNDSFDALEAFMTVVACFRCRFRPSGGTVSCGTIFRAGVTVQ